MRTILIILIVLIIGAGAYLGFVFLQSQKSSSSNSNGTTTTKTTSGPITLNFWGVYDDPSVFQPIIDAYKKVRPNVTIIYTRKEASLYEFVSLNELASQDGPDIWLVPSEWLPKHRDKLSAVPENLLNRQNPSPSPKPKGLFAKASPAPSAADFYTKLYAPVTAENNVVNGKIAALPLSVDTLGLYSNLALVQQLGLQSAPRTWEEIVTIAKQGTKRTNTTIDQPVIAMGTSDTVTRATDILANLFIQNHTPMVSEDHLTALFNQSISKATGEPVNPGQLALDFYTSFASPTKETYTWNSNLGSDYDRFKSGTLPFMIDYSFRIRDLLADNPTLSYQTSPLPQIAGTDQPVVLSTSQMVGVPLVSKNPLAAWEFISYLTNRQNSLAYANASGRPPARQDLLATAAINPQLQPFCDQAAFAQTWYRNEVGKANAIFRSAIDAVLAGQTVPDVINKLAKQMSHILRNEAYE